MASASGWTEHVTGSDCLAASLTWKTTSNTNLEHHHRKYGAIIIHIIQNNLVIVIVIHAMTSPIAPIPPAARGPLGSST